MKKFLSTLLAGFFFISYTHGGQDILYITSAEDVTEDTSYTTSVEDVREYISHPMPAEDGTEDIPLLEKDLDWYLEKRSFDIFNRPSIEFRVCESSYFPDYYDYYIDAQSYISQGCKVYKYINGDSVVFKEKHLSRTISQIDLKASEEIKFEIKELKKVLDLKSLWEQTQLSKKYSLQGYRFVMKEHGKKVESENLLFLVKDEINKRNKTYSPSNRILDVPLSMFEETKYIKKDFFQPNVSYVVYVLATVKLTQAVVSKSQPINSVGQNYERKDVEKSRIYSPLVQLGLTRFLLSV